MDAIDLLILREQQCDATRSFVDLGEAVGMSPASTHERVRKLRERGSILRTSVEVNPAVLGRDVLAFVTLSSAAWVGNASTRERLESIPEVEAATWWGLLVARQDSPVHQRPAPACAQ